MGHINPPKKIHRRQELRQDTLGTYTDRAVETFETHRRPLLISGAIALFLVLAWIGYSFWKDSQNNQAREALGSVVRLYEMGQYRQALEGTTNASGLIEIADRYGATKAGNLARYYAADAYLRLGENENALRYFSDFNKGDNIMGASAFAGEAAVYEDQGDYARAGRLYERAANAYESEATSPIYLMNAARNYEQANDFSAARRVYESIRKDFPDSQETRELDKMLARLDALTASNS